MAFMAAYPLESKPRRYKGSPTASGWRVLKPRLQVWLLRGEREVHPLPKHFGRKKTVIVKKIIEIREGHRVCYGKCKAMI